MDAYGCTYMLCVLCVCCVLFVLCAYAHRIGAYTNTYFVTNYSNKWFEPK